MVKQIINDLVVIFIIIIQAKRKKKDYVHDNAITNIETKARLPGKKVLKTEIGPHQSIGKVP